MPPTVATHASSSADSSLRLTARMGAVLVSSDILKQVGSDQIAHTPRSLILLETILPDLPTKWRTRCPPGSLLNLFHLSSPTFFFCCSCCCVFFCCVFVVCSFV